MEIEENLTIMQVFPHILQLRELDAEIKKFVNENY